MDLVWLIPAFPFAAFLINALFGRRFIENVPRYAGEHGAEHDSTESHGAPAPHGQPAPPAHHVATAGWRRRAAERYSICGIIATLSIFAAWLVTLPVFAAVMGGQTAQQTWWTWIPSGKFQATIGALVDPLSAVMLLVVTTCATLIHLYAVGYMEHDTGTHRFFSYMPLFTASMLLLVLADNFLQLYLAWEGVGVCSYLLIGYYFNRREPVETLPQPSPEGLVVLPRERERIPVGIAWTVVMAALIAVGFAVSRTFSPTDYGATQALCLGGFALLIILTGVFGYFGTRTELLREPRRYPPPEAAVKAFVVNRVGDFGFGIGVFLVFLTFGTLSYQQVFAAAPTIPVATLTLITLCLFAGACGKSAQFPLHTWLPDAMEGPTPVSALIHAATMVTAGVYMVARCMPLFSRAPISMAVVGTVGAISCILAATMALAQFDMKRVLAYSTMSQLGYMFLAEGVGAPASAIFHLYTHAFFKALLFLAAGSVLLAMEVAYHHTYGDAVEQRFPDFFSRIIDLRFMGGLRRRLPWTYWTFLIASVAIAGIPPLAGFWSKDEILSSAFAHGDLILYAIGLLVAVMTAFYMFRAVFWGFHGDPRMPEEVYAAVEESPHVMTVPLAILAFFAIVAGWAFSGAAGSFVDIHALLGHIPSLAPAEAAAEGGGAEVGLILASVAAGVIGIVLAWLVRDMYDGRKFAFAPAEFLRDVFNHRWYIDHLYNFLFDRGGHWFAEGLWRFDDLVVDGIVNGAAALVGGASSSLRQLQTGRIPNYALGIVTGMFVLVTVYWLTR